MASKDEERAYLQAFLSTRQDLCLGEIADAESPDFVATYDGGRVGIEVTRYSAAPRPGQLPAEEQDSLRQRVMQIARRQYEKAAGAPLHVQAIFSRHTLLSKRSAPELASKIASFLLSRTSGLTLYERAPFSYEVEHAFLPEIASLSAVRVPTNEHGVWYGAKGGWVRHVGCEEIVRILRQKDRRTDEYRNRCDQVWLLIAFPIVGNDTVDRVPMEPVEFSIATRFDRVFCVDIIGPRSVEIPVVSASVGDA